MKFAAVFAFLGLVAAALSAPVFRATVDLASVDGVIASGTGSITAASAADENSGVASGAVDGPGSVLGMATVGGALSGAFSSPSL